jgi:hypothetical protein
MSRTTPPATQAPSGTPLDASPHRSAVACAQSSNDPVAARSTPTPETAAAPANPRPATRSHAPVQAFEISDQQQPEVTARRQRRSSHRLRIEALTLAFDELVESVLGQYRVQLLVKGMPGCVRHAVCAIQSLPAAAAASLVAPSPCRQSTDQSRGSHQLSPCRHPDSYHGRLEAV